MLNQGGVKVNQISVMLKVTLLNCCHVKVCKNQCQIIYLFIWGFMLLSTGHIKMGSWEARGNQYIQLDKVLYCKLLTNGKQLPAFPFEVGPGTEPRSQRWEARVLLLYHVPYQYSTVY